MEAKLRNLQKGEEFKVKFEKYLNGLIHNSSKYFSLVAAFLIPLFLILDYFTVPSDSLGLFAIYRFTVTPLMIFQFLLIRYTRPGPKSLIHAYFSSSVIATMIILMTVQLGGFNSSYYAGLNLVLIAANLLIPLKPIHLFLNSSLVVIGYVVANFIWGKEFIVINLINNLYFISSTIVITLLSSFLRYNLLKQEFSLKLEIAQSKEKELETLNNQLLDAKSETDNILNNVKEGIFLLNDDYNISKQYSKILESIFESTEIGGQSFLTLIKKMIAENEMPPVRDFFDLLFARNITEKRLYKLNPLSEVLVEMQSGESIIKKFLKFDFKRIGNQENFAQVLTTVQDITAEKELTQKIQETAHKAEEQMQLLFHIIQIRPSLLEEFLRETSREMIEIENQLKGAQFSLNLIEIIQSIFRSIHSIKGNAGLLQLDIFVTFAHNFEEKLKALHSKPDLSSLDLLGLLYSIVELKKPLNMASELIQKIKSFQDSPVSGNIPDHDLFFISINSLVQRIAQRENRKVKVLMDDFSFPIEIYNEIPVIKNIIIQLIRNSIIHGVETKEERITQEKPDEALIELKCHKLADHVEISVKDDGRGVQIEKLKQSALTSNKYSVEEINGWSDAKIAALIYESGITTQPTSTLDAGRGVGLNIVKYEVEKMGGKIVLKFAPGQYTEFLISLPFSVVNSIPLNQNQENYEVSRSNPVVK